MVQLIEKRNTNYLPLFVLGSVGLQLVLDGINKASIQEISGLPV